VDTLSDIALIGLGVMGKNLALNMEEHGARVLVYNRSYEKTAEFMQSEARGKNFDAARTLGEIAPLLKRPRRVVMMVKAGQAVDDLIASMAVFLEPGDVLIDAGNSNHPDTERRTKQLQQKGIHYVGAGVSGGEEGARHGPSIMPGGDAAAWPLVKDLFQSIAAKTDNNEPCCDWVGAGGSGHFVKMVHNGIEYGDMQVICEAYDIMKRLLGLTNAQAAETFTQWNKGPLDSYLIEITASILPRKESDGAYVVDRILDTAAQKGTGKWTVENALAAGSPLTLVSEAVFARNLSALKDERMTAARVFPTQAPLLPTQNKEALLADLEKAVFASKIVSYAQGFALMQTVSNEQRWNLALGKIALLWRGGCIIRSKFLAEISAAFNRNAALPNLLVDAYFANVLKNSEAAWRRVISQAVLAGVPVPAMASALSYFDGYRSANLPANLLQAQRDFFGAHTYERTDKPRGKFFHSNWTGTPVHAPLMAEESVSS
jgi:6-phosphogluconate dehydrogenase